MSDLELAGSSQGAFDLARRAIGAAILSFLFVIVQIHSRQFRIQQIHILSSVTII